MSTALAIATPSPWTYMGDTMGSAGKLAHALVNTGLAPQGMTAPQAFYILIAGAELGLRGPVESLRHIQIIKGKPTISAEIMRAKMLEGGCRLDWERIDDLGATLRVTRPDGSSAPFSFTRQDAERAGLVGKGGSWSTYPQAMYIARATSLAARAFCPDMVRGATYTPEELEEIEDVTPEPEPETNGRAKKSRTEQVKDRLKNHGAAVTAPAPHDAPQAPADAGAAPAPSRSEAVSSAPNAGDARAAQGSESPAYEPGEAAHGTAVLTPQVGTSPAVSEDVFPEVEPVRSAAHVDAPGTRGSAAVPASAAGSLSARLADAALAAGAIDQSNGRTVIPRNIATRFGIKPGAYTTKELMETGAGFEIADWLEECAR